MSTALSSHMREGNARTAFHLTAIDDGAGGLHNWISHPRCPTPERAVMHRLSKEPDMLQAIRDGEIVSIYVAGKNTFAHPHGSPAMVTKMDLADARQERHT